MAEITKDTFSDWLFAKLKEKKIKQTQLADMMHVNRASVSKWISGAQYPHPATMRRLMTILGETQEEPEEETETPTDTDFIDDGEYTLDPHPEKILDMYKALSPKDQIYIRGMITYAFLNSQEKGK